MEQIKKNACPHEGGFTLIELLVAIGAMGLIFVIISNVLLTSLKNNRKTVNMAKVKQSGNNALQIMETIIKNAKSVTGSCTDGMSNISFTNQDNYPTQLSFDDTHCSGKIASISAGVNYYCLTSDDISLSSYQFDCSNAIANKPPVITIRFTLSAGNAVDVTEYVSQNFQTIVSLRNY